jgi:hypothetical protein
MMDADSSISSGLVLVAPFAPRPHLPPARWRRDAGRAAVVRACSSVMVKNENAEAQLRCWPNRMLGTGFLKSEKKSDIR